MHKFLAERKPSNPIVLTGDIHTSWVNDLKADYREAKSATIGTEFVGTSISSGGDGQPMTPAAEAFLPENPHVRFYNAQRGYVSCTVTPTRWQSDYRIVPFVPAARRAHRNRRLLRRRTRQARRAARLSLQDLAKQVGRY